MSMDTTTGVLNGLSPKYAAIFGEKYSKLYNEHIAGRRLAHDMTIEEYRANPVILSFGGAPGPQVGPVTDVLCPVRDGSQIILRVWHPQNYDKDASGNLPCYINFHGGGWVIGGLNDDEAFLRTVVSENNCIAIDVDYRMAPEHKFPVPMQDALDAYAWITKPEQLRSLGIDAKRIAVGGFSAGGQIAATLCQYIRDGMAGSDVVPCFQLLVIPVTDAAALDSDLEVAKDCPHESWRENHDGPFLSHARMSWFYRYYFPKHPSKAVLEDTLVSPLRAKSLANLPPALVVPAEVDVLRDEGIAYGRRLAKESGSWTQLWLAKGVPHPFPHQVEATPIAKEFRALAVHRLKQAFDGQLGEKQFISNV